MRALLFESAKYVTSKDLATLAQTYDTVERSQAGKRMDQAKKKPEDESQKKGRKTKKR